MNLKLLIIKVLLLICVTSAQGNSLQSLLSLDTRNKTEVAINNTLNYNDLIVLGKTQESEDNFGNPSASASSSSCATTTKAINYGTTKQDSLKDNDNGERRQQKQQQHTNDDNLYNHYPTIKFNNDNINLNALKTFTQDVAKQTIQATTKVTTFNENNQQHIKDVKNVHNDDEKKHDVVDNIANKADILNKQQQRNLYASNAFVGPMPQLQQQLYQQQAFLPPEYHHLSDYRLFFNPERHTEFYLHTLSLNLYGGSTGDGDEAGPKDDDVGTATDGYDAINYGDDVVTTKLTNLTNPRVFNVVTDTIGAAFGFATRPVAAIQGVRIEEIQLYNGLSLRQSRFNPFNPCRILIHGWLGGFNAGIYTSIVPEYLKLGQEESYNIFTVDWGKGAISDYVTASYRVKPVGLIVAKFIDFLHRESGIPLEKIQVIGFSMGAHIAGIAGKYVETGRLPVIYGLDPALPLFRYENQNERLDRNDADYVEVVHTSVGSYGYDRPLGHVDFYVNFGSNQPGCFFNECSHFRAFQIFAQTLNHEMLLGRECSMELWVDLIKHKRCLSETGLQLTMTAEGLNSSMLALRRGVYYLKTNSRPPYAIT